MSSVREHESSPLLTPQDQRVVYALAPTCLARYRAQVPVAVALMRSPAFDLTMFSYLLQARAATQHAKTTPDPKRLSRVPEEENQGMV
jgi:hypothetical protein